MIQKSYNTGLLGVALTLVGFGAGVPKAITQTTYPFEATYNAEITTIPLEQTDAGIVLETNTIGESTNAPYGLTNIQIENYSSVDPATGMVTYDSDPTTFGLEGLPVGILTLSGNGNDKLFGTNRGTVSGDTGSGTITLTGGEGRFVGATGSLDLFQTITSNPDPTGVTAPIISAATISGSFLTPEAVPEPKTDATLVGISMIGAGYLLHRCRRRSTI